MPYNLAMAALNFFIFYRLAAAALRLNYSIFCEPCRQIASDDEMQVSRLVMLLMEIRNPTSPWECRFWNFRFTFIPTRSRTKKIVDDFCVLVHSECNYGYKYACALSTEKLRVASRNVAKELCHAEIVVKVNGLIKSEKNAMQIVISVDHQGARRSATKRNISAYTYLFYHENIYNRHKISTLTIPKDFELEPKTATKKMMRHFLTCYEWFDYVNASEMRRMPRGFYNSILHVGNPPAFLEISDRQ